jgi:small conductance mechanosensitive channel
MDSNPRPLRKRQLRRPHRLGSASRYQQRAQGRLRAFRQGTILAVALTSFLLLFWDVTFAQEEAGPGDALAQAGGTVRELLWGFVAFLPKLGVALLLVLLGWGLAKLSRFSVRRTLGRSPRASSVLALMQMGISLLVAVAAISVLVGDVRALMGSLGLLGLALSWALQAPIESFAGWVLNTFRSYYRVGDRIEVGEVLGDVYKIDILTTTVWEIGRPGKAVQGAQPTGAMITFPNSEVLRANILNYSRDFPFVWEDVTIGFANESDFAYLIRVVRRLAREVVGSEMEVHARGYRDLLLKEGVYFDVEEEPQVYLSLTDSYVKCTVRYLVPIRARRRMASLLVERLLEETSKAEHIGKILSGYPRVEVKGAGQAPEITVRAG